MLPITLCYAVLLITGWLTVQLLIAAHVVPFLGVIITTLVQIIVLVYFLLALEKGGIIK